ncbi:MAG TPA: hypothetical protein VGQ76_25355 [Thermoanaerobaculia bacterium]|nr:hypothetical protein [Thermoanaerobaculia bacterium]
MASDGRAASQRGDVFQLRHGSAETAARHFSAAYAAFDAAGLTRETVRARWSLAETAAARGRFDEAIPESYKVQALLLADDRVVDAAIVSAEILDLLLVCGRIDEVLPLAERLVLQFAEAGLRLTAMQAWTFVRECARIGALTREEIAGVRHYFEDLPLRPNAPFLPPEAEQ